LEIYPILQTRHCSTGQFARTGYSQITELTNYRSGEHNRVVLNVPDLAVE
jgi:hypothetical protein